jgi:Calcineurin-like phosphoesterase superfamily domain
MIRFIGDTHAQFPSYLKLVDFPHPTIQVGDFGLGFGKPAPEVGPKDRFIRGNHDNPDLCKENSQWIPDGTWEYLTSGEKIMYVGGALSIDRHWRKEGVNWWNEEELTISELYQIIDKYEDAKPQVMVSHDSPENIAGILFMGYIKRDFHSRTRQALQSMLDVHQPALWVFGHWHMNRTQKINNTLFVCCGELVAKDFPEFSLAGEEAK